MLAYGIVFTVGRIVSEVGMMVAWPVQNCLNRSVLFRCGTHAHALGLRYHVARKTGQVTETIRRGMGGLSVLQNSVLMIVLPLVLQLGVVSWVLTTRLDAIYTAVIVATVVVYGVVVGLSADRQAPLQRNTNAQFTQTQIKAVDGLLNYETVKYFGAERHVLARLAEGLKKWKELGLLQFRWRTLGGVLPALVMGAGLTTMLWSAARRSMAGEITVGGLVLVNTYLMQVLLPLDRMGQFYREISQALVNIENLTELLHEVPEIADGPGATPITVRSGHIEFRDVDFAYDPRRPILQKVTFTVPAGSSTALVGTTGSGKTTVGRLLFRFYEPTGGTITVDGQDVRRATVRSLRGAIGVVPQDTVLFNR